MKKKIILTKKLAFAYKLSIVIALSLLPLFIIIIILDAYLFPGVLLDAQEAYVSFCFVLGISLSLGFFVLIVPFVVEDPNNVMSSVKKADKFIADVSSVEDFLNKSDASIIKYGYLKIQDKCFENYRVLLYAKRSKWLNVDIMQIIITDELTDDILNSSNDNYVQSLEEYCNKGIWGFFTTSSVKTVVVVNKMNNVSRRFFNSETDQEFDNPRFVAGLSLGGKKLYISNASYYATVGYKKQRKLFLKIFDFLISK